MSYLVYLVVYQMFNPVAQKKGGLDRDIMLVMYYRI